MNKKLLAAVIVPSSFIIIGCACVQEPFKTFWGSSTRVLQKARAEAMSKTYPQASNEVFQEILKIVNARGWEIFIQNKKKGLIDVMGVNGSVNTTEVGIFVSALKEKETKIEISSLSSNAKRKVAEALFGDLDKMWPQ